MSTVDQKNVETTALMQENMEEPVSTPTQEAQNHVCTPTQEVLVAYGGENPGEPVPVSSGEDEMASEEQVNSKVADGDCILTVDNHRRPPLSLRMATTSMGLARPMAITLPIMQRKSFLVMQ